MILYARHVAVVIVRIEIGVQTAPSDFLPSFDFACVADAYVASFEKSRVAADVTREPSVVVEGSIVDSVGNTFRGGFLTAHPGGLGLDLHTVTDNHTVQQHQTEWEHLDRKYS